MTVQRLKSDKEYRQSEAERDVYSDWTTSFIAHPFNGQITRVTNVDSVRQSIRNLILTNKYERLKNPTFGCNIRRHLFEQFSPLTMQRIEEDIRQTVNGYEPRARIEEINITPSEDKNSIDISILFYVVTAKEVQEMSLTLYRVR